MNKTIIAALLLATTISCQQPNRNTAEDGVQNDSTSQTDTTRIVTIAMTGDIMLGNLWPHERLPIDSARHVLEDPAPVIRQADVACGNLEGTFAYTGKPRKNPNSKLAFMFMMPPHFVHRLTEAGYDFMCVANNHINDFFLEGMTSTEQTLRQAGIGFAGIRAAGGKDQHPDRCIRTLNGVKYGFCAFSNEFYTMDFHDSDTVKAIITDLRRQCDYVIVCFHGGNEGTAARHLPDEEEFFHGDRRGHLRKFAHECIDWGADIVFGSGPHVCRAIEMYNDHLIAYSLGNFATCGMGVVGATGFAPVITARLDHKGRFVDGHIHSFLQQPMKGPKTDPQHHAAKEIAELTQADISPNLLNISPEGVITRK